MKAWFAILSFCLLSGAAMAAEKTPVIATPWHFDLFPLNGELRYERDPAQQMVDRRPVGFAVGVGRAHSTVIFEYSHFSQLSGNATLLLDRQHREYVLWWKQNLLQFEFVDFFLSAGVGGAEEQVTTTLAGVQSTTDTGGMQAMGGASAGLQSMMFKYVLCSVEGRLIAGKNFDPNPQPSLLLRLGVEF